MTMLRPRDGRRRLQAACSAAMQLSKLVRRQAEAAHLTGQRAMASSSLLLYVDGQRLMLPPGSIDPEMTLMNFLRSRGSCPAAADWAA